MKICVKKLSHLGVLFHFFVGRICARGLGFSRVGSFTNVDVGVSLNGGTPKTPEKGSVLVGKPWLLGITILGNPHVLHDKCRVVNLHTCSSFLWFARNFFPKGGALLVYLNPGVFFDGLPCFFWGGEGPSDWATKFYPLKKQNPGLQIAIPSD